MPESWDETFAETNEAAETVAARRATSGVPDTVRHRPKWEQALEMIDELATWGHLPPLVVLPTPATATTAPSAPG